MMQQAAWIAAALVFAMGLYSLCTQRHLIRLCVALGVMETSVLIALAALAWRPDAQAPIVTGADGVYADPLPHALALTAIVIGAATLSLALALTILVFRTHGTLDIETLRDIGYEERRAEGSGVGLQ